MDDISKLLQEAKPLYFVRKRRHNRIKASLAMLICVVMFGAFYQKTNNANQVSAYSYLLYDSYTTEMVVSDEASVIEEMGLPTDEYGLLMVG